MNRFLSTYHDLISPDGKIDSIQMISKNHAEAEISIHNISSLFIGFDIDHHLIEFNLKSTLGQLGLHCLLKEIVVDKNHHKIFVKLDLIAYGEIAIKTLQILKKGSYVGKLFAKDDRRKVRDPEYLLRMFDRKDEKGNPLLYLSNPNEKNSLILQKQDGFTLAYLPLKHGTIEYNPKIQSFIPLLEDLLLHTGFQNRRQLSLYQTRQTSKPRIPEKDDILLVKTQPLHIRTAFGRIADQHLPKGFEHTASNILDPDTKASGDIFEFFGSSTQEITDVPLEFYTLEPYREYVFFSDRDQLKERIEHPENLFDAFQKAPNSNKLASIFIVKSKQLDELTPESWIQKEGIKHKLPGFSDPVKQTTLINDYIESQPLYPFCKAMEEKLITSQGIFLSKYFPSPTMKKPLLSTSVTSLVKGIYFETPSRAHGEFFSHEDRAFLYDLYNFAIPVYWVDKRSKQILQFTIKQNKESGMFVPLHLTSKYQNSTFFGVYGSNLIEGNFEEKFEQILLGIKSLKEKVNHPLLNSSSSLAMVTGGGPGVMNLASKIAQKAGYLSCANVVDFSQKNEFINEQKQSPYIDAKMTYRIDRLVERQAEFYLDFPIFFEGGIGTDFELSLEEVRRKVGAHPPHPILLFGTKKYWKDKITSRFKRNLKTGTIKGSEWLSNCFYCTTNPQKALQMYEDFFFGKLPIGKNGPIYKNGFCCLD